MNRARSRRLLLIAFAISLLVHVVIARYIHGTRPTRESSEEVATRVRVMHVQRIPKATPPPTPPPKPKPTPNVTASKQPNRPATIPRATSKNGRNAANPTAATPQPAPSSLPTPIPATTAPPAAPTPCAGRIIPPQVLQTPPPPSIPSEARAKGTQGVAAIDVTIDAAGQVLSTKIQTSSGDATLDDIATQMARASTYSPATNNCAKVAGIATFTVQFFLL